MAICKVRGQVLLTFMILVLYGGPLGALNMRPSAPGPYVHGAASD